MPEEKIDLNSFLEEMVSLTSDRLKKQERMIEGIRKEVEELKKGLASSKKPASLKVDRSVLRVLKGEG